MLVIVFNFQNIIHKKCYYDNKKWLSWFISRYKSTILEWHIIVKITFFLATLVRQKK